MARSGSLAPLARPTRTPTAPLREIPTVAPTPHEQGIALSGERGGGEHGLVAQFRDEHRGCHREHHVGAARRPIGGGIDCCVAAQVPDGEGHEQQAAADTESPCR